MKIQKRHWFIIFPLLLLTLGIETYYYSQLLKIEDVEAVTVGIPNPGHSLAQLECSADSLCVDTANNRVGIGTNNPAAKLHVSNGGTYLSQWLWGENNDPTGYDTFGIKTWNNISFYSTWSGATYTTAANPGILFSPRDGSAYFNGNVGIGTTSPVSKLDVAGAVRTNTDFYLDGSDRQRFIYLNYNFAAYPNYSSYIAQTGAATVAGTAGLVLNANIGSTSPNYGINFAINNSSKMFIQHTGNVGIGTTSPGYTLTVAGTAWVTSGSWSGSDIRWKKNIETLSQSSSLEKVMALNPVNYQWKTDEYPEMKFQTGTQLGFIAQDVEKIIPEVVTTNNEGYKGISYEKIVPVLTSAIQEQEKKIETLSSQNQSLKVLVCLDHPLAEVCN